MNHHFTKNKPTKQARPQGRVSRHEYLCDARHYAKRGQELPQSALLDLEVIEIRRLHAERLALLQHIRDELSNDALAQKFKVHVRTIERIVQRETWSHLL